MNRTLCCMLLALLLPLPAQAAPELNIGGLYDYIDGGKSTLLKRVRNGGDTTAFVKISAAELVYDKDGTAREIDLESLPLEQRGLVVSPARLIVPARGLQSSAAAVPWRTRTRTLFSRAFHPGTAGGQ